MEVKHSTFLYNPSHEIYFKQKTDWYQRILLRISCELVFSLSVLFLSFQLFKWFFLNNNCRMPARQNCLGDIPCSHSLQSRDFSNGSKGAFRIYISSTQVHMLFLSDKPELIVGLLLLHEIPRLRGNAAGAIPQLTSAESKSRIKIKIGKRGLSGASFKIR